MIGSDVTTFDNESISGGAITVYNSAGTPVNVQLRWAMTDSASLGTGHTNTWNLFYQSDPNATGSAVAWTNVGQNFTFNANGNLTSPAGGSITIPGVSVSGQQVGDLALNFSSGALTQFASSGGTATIGQITQNGFAAGQLQSVAINNSGLVVGTFSNGQNIDLASITLSHFNGTNYLKALDGEAYAVDRPVRSGDPRRVGNDLGFVARRLEHRHRRRVHETDRHPAGLFGQHQGDHHGQRHGSDLLNVLR